MQIQRIDDQINFKIISIDKVREKIIQIFENVNEKTKSSRTNDRLPFRRQDEPKSETLSQLLLPLERGCCSIMKMWNDSKIGLLLLFMLSCRSPFFFPIHLNCPFNGSLISMSVSWKSMPQ